MLPLTDRTDGLPLATVRLHGRPLFAHAVRTLLRAGGDGVVVTAATGGEAAVRDELGDDPRVTVIDGGDTLGQALVEVLRHVVSVGVQPGLVVVHDPRCPLVPAAFVRDVVAEAASRPDSVLVGTRPMTDTVKCVVDGVVETTVDRDLLVVLASPLVLQLGVLRRLAERPELARCADVEDVVSVARTSGVAVHWLPAPVLAWRVDDASGVGVLESVTDVGDRGA